MVGGIEDEKCDGRWVDVLYGMKSGWEWMKGRWVERMEGRW